MDKTFKPISHDTWLKQVVKDLRGDSIVSKNWILEENISIDNFEEIDINNEINFSGLSQSNNQDNSWLIVESFIDHDLNNLNTDLLQALNYGLQDILLPFELIDQQNNLNSYFKNIALDYIELSFRADSIRHVVDQLKHVDDGSMAEISSFLLNSNFEWGGLINLNEANEYLQQFLRLDLNTDSMSSIFISYRSDKGVSYELYTILDQLNIWSIAAESNSVNFERLYNNMTISLEMEDRYFVNIAKIRALKILLSNWSNMYFGKTVVQPTIKAIIKEDNTEDQNISIIPMTWKAMSAVIAGVDKVQIEPIQNDSDTRRNTRNIHHLLCDETYLDKVIDPSAGSYFIEQTTQKIAQKSWTLFYNNMDNYAS